MNIAEELLPKVKAGMLLTGDFQDATLKIFIEDVISFLIDAGVDPALLYTKQAVGLITRGVIDLWNYGPGEAEFSPYFKMRAIQLINTRVKRVHLQT